MQIGSSDLDVAPLALGGNVFGWTADEAMSFRVLDAFVGAGFNLIDTADVYSKWIDGHVGGESETVIGNWLERRGRRDDVVIATKFGMEMTPDEKGLSREYMFKSVDRSLQRLKTDYIDLYQAHCDDKDTPFEETLGAFAELIAAGKVRAIGASNYSAERLAAALETSANMGCRVTRRCSPGTTSTTGALSKDPSRSSVATRASALSVTSASRAAS